MTEQNIKDAVARYLQRTGFDRFTPKAALIDMDGTLYDSMGNHTAAWRRMMLEQGVDVPQDEFYLYEGMTGSETINMLFKRELNREATPQERKELYRLKTEYFNELPKVKPVEGAAKMLRTLIDAGITRVLVTGSGQPSTIERLDREFPGAFPQGMKITSHDVTRCKPDPQPYEKGMEKAGASPWESIVIENAPLGVKAGAAAGAFTVGVTTGPIPAAEMAAAGADIIFPSMEEFADALPLLLDYSNKN